ncbi:alpha/beta fold hydrolase [Streptomyces sp. NBC_00669]|uniref:alpha/beta fold hydrolase n=1 Tax=Streptomyces sp. NBC_00669 TaxID=2976011 RepID=UPI002E31CD08|nr:alpha/beta fold hydrolase [Streptomyces sp. NBC_00669]
MATGEVDALPDRGLIVNGVVLVHGLYHDPRHFDLVVAELAAAGVEVAVPELHRGSLAADTAAVQAVVDAMAEPPLIALLASAIVRDDDGRTRVDATAAVEAFYADAPIERAAWATSLLRPQKPGCGRGVPARQSWRSTPSTYVTCARDRAVDPDLQRRMSRRCSRALTWHTSHSPFVSRPGKVAALLRSLLLPADGHP